MKSEELATAVVGILESALDDIRESYALAGAMANQETTGRMEPLWRASANTTGMLAVIYEDYPDLAGEDPAGATELAALIAEGGLGPETAERIVALLEDARGLLRKAGALSAQATGIAVADKEHLAMRFAESDTSIESTVQALTTESG